MIWGHKNVIFVGYFLYPAQNIWTPQKTPAWCGIHFMDGNYTMFCDYHRVNGSSSPVLTATCLSYGSLCDFLTFFPQPTWRSHPSTDFDAKWLKQRGFTKGRAFWGYKSHLFETPDPQTPKSAKICQFWSGQKNLARFRPCSDFMDILRRLTSCRIIIIIIIIIINIEGHRSKQ